MLLDSNCAFSLITNTDELRSVKETLYMEDVGSWIEAMDDEMASLDKKIGTLYLFLNDEKPIGTKWVFKKRFYADGSVERLFTGRANRLW